MKAIDLTGQVFDYLTVVTRVADYVSPKGDKKPLWKCVCKCGNEVFATCADLRKGKVKSCGCRKKDLMQERIATKVGDKYVRLTVLERIGYNKDGRVTFKCKCDCGNEVVVSGKYLRHSKTCSCGCLAKEITSKSHSKDLTGQRFGKLIALERAETVYSKNGNPQYKWKCKCDCGNITIVSVGALTSNHTRSCGCMKNSFREEQITKHLKEHNIHFTREYFYKDLLSPSGHPLRFDFAILDDNNHVICLIEHQGEQHFIIANNGFGKLQREVTDKLKDEYCSKNHIQLFKINYFDDINQSFKHILNYIQHVNSVPSLAV